MINESHNVDDDIIRPHRLVVRNKDRYICVRFLR